MQKILSHSRLTPLKLQKNHNCPHVENHAAKTIDTFKNSRKLIPVQTLRKFIL